MDILVSLTASYYNRGIGDLIVLVFVFILIIIACYYSTKWVSKKGLNIQKTKNIKVLEVFRMNQSAFLYLVKVGDKVMTLGVTKDHIEYLAEINEESLDFSQSEKSPASFQELFKMYKDKKEE